MKTTLSAEAATKSRLHLSTTYELLLAAPEMVQAWKKKGLCESSGSNNGIIRRKPLVRDYNEDEGL